jgi:uncharacterized ion transporter superfamily protein YfcC
MLIRAGAVTSGVDREFFVVAAQVIPILLLAYVVEARVLIRKAQEEEDRTQAELQKAKIDPDEIDILGALSELSSSRADWKRMSHHVGGLTMVWAGVAEAISLVAIATNEAHIIYFLIVMFSIGLTGWWLTNAALAFFIDADFLGDDDGPSS